MQPVSPDISLVVAVYKDAQSLSLILEALEKQSYKNFEIIVAEDCESDEIKNCIKNYAHLNLKHTTQKDVGWRKNSSLNNAIRVASSDFLLFIDGDCIPNIHFVREYNKQKEKNTVLCGRRVELGSRFTKQIRERKLNILDIQKNYLLNIFNFREDNTRHFEEGIYLGDLLFNLKHKGKEASVLGCNFGINKSDLIEINGFNEDYVSPSVGEDTDIEYRLRLKGCNFKRIRNRSFVFHLYHEEVYSPADAEKSMKVFNKVKENKQVKCKIGLTRE
ncbi:glycosyltransferase [Sulfurimonas sp.]|uniref:glycosyltransferase n=1 Tax=Sulfurimonas sp. TaxID=2022749 RepID=UPI0025F20A77|nr:glycosyltransferase [Sulfurimonas sp.]MDD5156434.1 glycosyltransferase [Sulfurimonas sp.]